MAVTSFLTDKNLYVSPEYVAFEDGQVPCGGKTVSTRAHIRKVQPNLCKRHIKLNYVVKN